MTNILILSRFWKVALVAIVAIVAAVAFQANDVFAVGSGDACGTTAGDAVCDAGLQCFNGVCTKYGLEAIDDADATTGVNLGSQDLVTTITQIINLALSLLGIIAVIIILIGGFKWMTAGGNEDKVGEARKMIFAGIIGLAIILSAWAIAKFVITQLADVTDAPL